MKKSLKVSTGMGPVPVVMVSCGNNEESNITTIAWTGIINSEPPLVYVSIRPTRHSYNIIKETNEFVINIPDDKLVWQTDLCGTKSGKNIDKFKEAKLTKQKSIMLEAPSIEECPINIECKLIEIKELGSHHMFIGKVVSVNAEEKYILENGNINYSSANLLTYAGNEYLAQNNKIGERGICLR